jgi:hypothetical protein
LDNLIDTSIEWKSRVMARRGGLSVKATIGVNDTDPTIAPVLRPEPSRFHHLI